MSNPRRKKGEFGRCVRDVTRRGGADDPRAVCAASFTRAYGEGYLHARNAVATSKRRRMAFFDWLRKNPAADAEEAFEKFTGRAADDELVFETREHEHEYFADIGELREMVIVPSGERKGVKLFGFRGARLAMNESGILRNELPQIYVIGGDQSVDLREFGIDPTRAHEREELGKLVDVTYYQTKDHLGRDGGTADYEHRLSEETAKGKPVSFRILAAPTATYDVINEVISIWGGTYEITPEGIRD